MKPIILISLAFFLFACEFHRHNHHVTLVHVPPDPTIPIYDTHCFDRRGRSVPMGQVNRTFGDRCVLERVN